MVRPVSAERKKLSSLSKMPLKGNLEKALLESQNLNESLGELTVRFWRPQRFRYHMSCLYVLIVLLYSAII